MTLTEKLERHRELAKLASEKSSQRWVKSATREDGTEQVYSPSRGPLRVIVPVAESEPPFSAHIAANHPAVVSALVEVAKAAVRAGKGEPYPGLDSALAKLDAALVEE